MIFVRLDDRSRRDEGETKMATGTTGNANKALVERMRALYETGDFEAIERAALEYWTNDTVEEFPQSGEIFHGRAAAQAFLDASAAAYGGMPRFAFRELRGRDDLWVIEGTIDYGNGVTTSLVTIAELVDGTIRRQTDYFAAPFEAPEWRAPFHEPAA
jgi:CO/xanthine dehydrogenase Mo-binding subunit